MVLLRSRGVRSGTSLGHQVTVINVDGKTRVLGVRMCSKEGLRVVSVELSRSSVFIFRVHCSSGGLTCRRRIFCNYIDVIHFYFLSSLTPLGADHVSSFFKAEKNSRPRTITANSYGMLLAIDAGVPGGSRLLRPNVAFPDGGIQSAAQL